MRRRRPLDLLAIVHLCHAANPSTSKTGVLVAVSPAINRPLDQASLSAQRWVQLRQSPAHPIAVCFIHQAISAVLILGATSSGINAILLLELGRQVIGSDRLNITPDGVLQLDTIARVLKRDPLDAIAVLPHNQRGGCWDRSGCSIRVDPRSRTSWALQLGRTGLVLLVLGHRRCLGRLLKLHRYLGRDLGSGAARHASLSMLRGMLCHLILRRRVRHHHVGLGSQGLLRVVSMLGIRRSRRMMRHGLVM